MQGNLTLAFLAEHALVSVRPAAQKDAAELAAVVRAAFESYRGRLNPSPSALSENAESIGARLAGGYGLAAVAKGGIVGCVLASLRDPGEAYIGRLAVLPIWRRRGIGRMLMERGQDAARARGCAAMSLGVRLALPENIAFFERLGFQVVREECHPGFAQPTYVTMAKYF